MRINLLLSVLFVSVYSGLLLEHWVNQKVVYCYYPDMNSMSNPECYAGSSREKGLAFIAAHIDQHYRQLKPTKIALTFSEECFSGTCTKTLRSWGGCPNTLDFDEDGWCE